jgi:hypothetical protein
VSRRAPQCPHCGCPIAPAQQFESSQQPRRKQRAGRAIDKSVIVVVLGVLALIGSWWMFNTARDAELWGRIKGLNPRDAHLYQAGGVFLLCLGLFLAGLGVTKLINALRSD